MPSMADFAPLLEAKGIDLPTPMQYAGQALTLGNMALGNQMQQLQLQKMQDMISAVSNPAYLQAVSQMFGGGGTGMGGGMPPDLSFLSGNKAAPELLQNLFGMAEKSSQIGKNYAEAGKMGSETLNMGLTRVLNSAAGTPPEQVTPQLASFWYHQLSMMGFDPRQIGAGNAATPADFRDALVSQLQDPKTRQQLINEATENWAKQAGVMQKQAELGKTEFIKGEGGVAAFHPTQPPNLPPAPGALGQQWGAQAPPFQGVPAGATVKLTGPASASDVQTLLNAAAQEGGKAPAQPVQQPQGTKVAGQGPNVFATPGQKGLDEGAAKQISEAFQPATGAVPVSQELQQQLMRLRDLDNRGIFDGPLGASKLWKELTGIFAPYMSPQDRAKVETSQAFNAEAGSILAKYAQQTMGARMSKGALMLLQPTKVSDVMQPGARRELYNAFFNSAQRNLDYWNGAASYVADANNMGKGLSGYSPKYAADVGMPVTPGARAWSQQAEAYLRAHPETKAQFDERFGVGAAAQVLGQ